MKITKYEHACLDIQQQETRLIIDPGVFSKSLTDFTNVHAVVVTHVHPDHFDPKKVNAIIQQNPQVQIATTQEVAEQINYSGVHTPTAGESLVMHDITLEFFGGKHAVISPDYPAAQNIGVLVDDPLYYPGDSLVPCPKPHKVVAVPTMAPWLKFSEAAEFLQSNIAEQVFPTRNGFINTDGQALYDRLFGSVCEKTGKEYQFITPGSSAEV